MGRIRIKKKDTVIPFRQTLAYRTILAGASFVAFIVALFVMISSISTNMTMAIAAVAVGAAAAFGVFYNLDHMRHARVPKRTLDRMKRR
jgi:archaellum biogenesis protein FlaJ (TadC family)